MLHTPMDVLHQFPVRKSKQQKQAFREAVCSYASSQQYQVTVEDGFWGSRNMVIGNPEEARYLVTAHYDTCPRLPFPNWITPCNAAVFCLYQTLLAIALLLPPLLAGALAAWISGALWVGYLLGYLLVFVTLVMLLFGPANPSNANDNTSGVIAVLEILRTMPENQRSKVCFVLFDLEEVGMLGSSDYRKRHREASNRQLVLNCDCVGDGDYLRMFPTNTLRKDRKKLTALYKACGYFGPKSLLVQETGRFFYPSDQMVFPYGVGICALNKGKTGLYLGRIHTPKDTILEQTNINILRAALTSFICCDAGNEKGRNENETV